MAGPRGQHRLRRGCGAYAATAVRARTVRHRALHRHYSYCRGRAIRHHSRRRTFR